MGYYTKHNLSIINESNSNLDLDLNDHKEAISKSADYQYCFEDSIKWYQHEQHMRTYSKQYPNLIFELIGEGEESGDLWKEYYKNGKMQRSKAAIAYEPLDESKLK